MIDRFIIDIDVIYRGKFYSPISILIIIMYKHILISRNDFIKFIFIIIII